MKIFKYLSVLFSGYMFWILVVSVPTGFVVSTFTYSKGYSYLSNNPEACVNCHIMNEQYDSYMNSSHRHVAVCNDCHTPKNIVGKYVSKAINGWNHGNAFTTGDFKWPIRINNFNKTITNNSCLKCHDNITHEINTDKINCLQCHSEVGHHL